MLNTTVFQAFPHAIEQWGIAEAAYSTITGNMVDEWENIDVIVDEGSGADENRGTTAAIISSDTLIYCQPDQLPTLDTAKLMASYMVKDTFGKIYEIRDAGIGKNQETGAIEHVELRVRQTGADSWPQSQQS